MLRILQTVYENKLFTAGLPWIPSGVSNSIIDGHMSVHEVFLLNPGRAEEWIATHGRLTEAAYFQTDF